MDPLVSSQKRLFALIKQSHRLLLTMMAVSLLIIPAVLTFILLIEYILKQIEHDFEMSQLLTGLTTYITHLLRFLEPFPFRSEKHPPPSLSENLERFERRLKRQKYQEIALFIFFVILLTNYLRNIAVRHPNVIRQPLIYVALAGIFLFLALRSRMVIKWGQIANQWVQGFYALNTWGKNLERLFHQQQGAEGDYQ